MAKLCSVKICDRPRAAGGLCHAHYGRMNRLGSTYPDIPIQPSNHSLANPRPEGRYSSKQACEMADITYRQLDYWTNQGRVVPTRVGEGSGHQHWWSLEDIATLQDLVRRVRECPHAHT